MKEAKQNSGETGAQEKRMDGRQAHKPGEAATSARELPQTDAGVERYARDIEKATKKAIAQGPVVPVWIDPVIGRDGEVLTYRLNGVAYHIKTKQVVHVPEALAMVLYDQARRKKLSARSVQEYTAGLGKGLGELK